LKTRLGGLDDVKRLRVKVLRLRRTDKAVKERVAAKVLAETQGITFGEALRSVRAKGTNRYFCGPGIRPPPKRGTKW
jgi:hypothetical protein